MGYETHFRLKGELDSKFKSWMKDPHKEDMQEYKDILVATCLKSYVKDNDYTNLVKARKAVSFAVKIYVNYLAEQWKYSLEQELKNNNNETWFCGWNCSHNESTWTSEQDVIDWYTSQLFMSAISPFTFDPDAKEDYSRMRDIKENVDDIEDSVRELWRYLFIEHYRDSDEAEESDGYDRHFSDGEYDEEVEDTYSDTLDNPPTHLS